MSKFRLSRCACEDLANIHSYLAPRNAVAADRLLRGLFDLFRTLSNNPLLGELRTDLRPNLRVIAHAGYAVCYFPLADGVEIVTVLHGARDIDTLFREGTV